MDHLKISLLKLVLNVISNVLLVKQIMKTVLLVEETEITLELQLPNVHALQELLKIIHQSTAQIVIINV